MPDLNWGTLYGLGVGPGDPKLLTLRAREVLEQVRVLFAAGSSKNDYSIALNVVEEHIGPDTEVHKLDFPMTSRKEELKQAWLKNAEQVREVLASGRDAAFVTIGDPLTYSTFSYLLRTIRELEPEVPVEIVPGITAYQAAAARLNLPLVEGKESLMVVSGINDASEISRLASCGDTVVIMKAYRNYDKLLEAIEGLPEEHRVCTVSACGLTQERVEPDAFKLRGKKMPYLSLLIVKDREKE